MQTALALQNHGESFLKLVPSLHKLAVLATFLPYHLLYKLSQWITCPQYNITYDDGLIVHTHVNYHSRLLVCTILIIIMDHLSTLI